VKEIYIAGKQSGIVLVFHSYRNSTGKKQRKVKAISATGLEGP
jgi:hypothetical protein